MISITLELLKPSSLIWWIADNSDWLGACAAKGKTITETTNTANALAYFRTIVLRSLYLHFSLVRKSPKGSSRFACDAVDRKSVSFAMQLNMEGRASPAPTGIMERWARQKNILLRRIFFLHAGAALVCCECELALFLAMSAKTRRQERVSLRRTRVKIEFFNASRPATCPRNSNYKKTRR